jgi:adenine-specific DNA-methyltransferase
MKYKGLRRGGVLEFSEKPLSIIPIKRIDWSNEREVKIYNDILFEVDRIIKERNSSDKKLNVLIKKLYEID